jgi:hypothetical protein
MSENSREDSLTGDTCSDLRHPLGCDPVRCTADPTATVLAERGEHRSAGVSVDLAGAMWLPEQAGTADLTEAAAPWRCSPYLHVRVGPTELAVPIETAGPLPTALSGLIDTARERRTVTR